MDQKVQIPKSRKKCLAFFEREKPHGLPQKSANSPRKLENCGTIIVTYQTSNLPKKLEFCVQKITTPQQKKVPINSDSVSPQPVLLPSGNKFPCPLKVKMSLLKYPQAVVEEEEDTDTDTTELSWSNRKQPTLRGGLKRT